MSSNYPTSLDTFTNPSGGDLVSASIGSRTHSQFHADVNDAVESIEAKLGTGGTTPVTNKLLRGTSASASDWDTTAPTGTIIGTTDTQTLSNKSLIDNSTFIIDDSDATKKVKFEVSGVTTATTRTKTFQDVSGTVYETGGQDVAIADGGTGASTAVTGFNNLSPSTTKGDLIVNDGTNDVRQAVGSNGLVLAANSATTSGVEWTSAATLAGIKFGGTGVDGALSVSSGTTTIDLGNATVYVKNYSSISITGTGKIAFINPNTNGTLIIIKCSGDCTLTSSTAPMIDASGMGGQGAAGGTTILGGQTATGDNGLPGKTYGFLKTNFGVGGVSNNAGAGGAVGTFGFMDGVQTFLEAVGKYPKMFLGAGGGGSGSQFVASVGTVTGGTGGAGGGCLILEIAGAINFTTAGGISVGGIVGGNGSTTGTPGNASGGGGGGGGGGSAFIFYNTLTAFSGTVTVAGGIGGNMVNSNGAGAGGGGGGGSGLNAGANATTDTVSGNKTGGNGGAGLAINALNTEF